jgi:hypothetical protein
MYIEEIARMVGMRKPTEVREYERISRSGWRRLMEGRSLSRKSLAKSGGWEDRASKTKMA